MVFMDTAHQERRALVVIDAQNEYVTGGVPIEFPPVADSLERMVAAIDAAAKAGIPVVLVHHDAPAESPVFAVGSQGWELHPDVASRSHKAAKIMGKSYPSAFTATDLEAWLRDQEVTTVAFAGYMTQNCDQSSVVNAAHLGFQVEFLSDASGAISLANEAGRVDAASVHEVFCTVLQSNFAAVMTVSQWVDVLDGRSEPVRSNILASQAAAHR